jgi:rRNA biogenesis protein RRP5
MFESLTSAYPKRLDLWNQFLDLEIQQGDDEAIRSVFERALRNKNMKPRNAKGWFKRWLEWEETRGDKNGVEKVKARAEAWVRTHTSKDLLEGGIIPRHHD